MTLEEVLSEFFGCKKLFLKKRKICGYLLGEPCYEYITKNGGRAYGRLTDLLYSLEELLGGDFEADRWIDELDYIMRNE